MLGVEFEVSRAREVDAEGLPVSFRDNKIPELIYVDDCSHGNSMCGASRVNPRGGTAKGEKRTVPLCGTTR